ncbi:MAG: hypothetical protein Q7S55_02455 [Nanoarchaeota archaeon]|nr:hypothetical protein [Nanoarchaeota archaeon]
MGIADLFVPDPEQFREKCRQRERQTTIAHFGLDMMIDRQGDIYCIEINGQNSGTKGFEEAYGEDFARKKTIDFLASFGLPVTIYNFNTGKKDDRWAEDALDVKGYDSDKFCKFWMGCAKEALGMLESLEEMHNAQKTGKPLDETAWTNMSDEEYYQRRASLPFEEAASFEVIFRSILSERAGLRAKTEKMKGLYGIDQTEGIIWSNTNRNMGVNWVFDEDRFLLVNPELIEWATENKLASEILMQPYSLISCPMLSEQLEPGNEMLGRYLNAVNRFKVVLKPVNGSLGDGVVVLDKRKFLNSQGKLRKEIGSYLAEPEKYFDDEKIIKGFGVLKDSKEILVQPFIESRPFYNPKTKKHHHGSIRYIVMMHSDGGNISVEHAGGYVRLAPEPIGDSPGACVANLAKGAEAVPLSRKDQNRLEKWIDVVMPHFYRRALRLEASLEFPVDNCVFVEKFEHFYKSPGIW